MGESKQEVKPRFIIGAVIPAGEDRLPNSQPQPLLPPDVRTISSALNIIDYTREGVNEAIDTRYWNCVNELVQQGAQRITLNGFPVAAQLGRERVLELDKQTAARTNVAAEAQAEATIAALRHLRCNRIAIASRWADELNKLIVTYLEHAGIEVLAITTANQWGRQAFSMSIEEGVKLAFQLGREAMRRAPGAEALFVAGGAWRSLAAVPILEEDYGIPVITNPIAPVWRLINAGVAPPVQGWGSLLSNTA
jgi:maleate cis-trans isomerase